MHIMHSSITVSFTHLEESNVPTKTLFFFTKNSEHCSLLSISERANDLLDASQSTGIVVQKCKNDYGFILASSRSPSVALRKNHLSNHRALVQSNLHTFQLAMFLNWSWRPELWHYDQIQFILKQQPNQHHSDSHLIELQVRISRNKSNTWISRRPKAETPTNPSLQLVDPDAKKGRDNIQTKKTKRGPPSRSQLG